MLAKDFPYSLCLNAPSMTVITINKVQDIYNNPVYDTVPEELAALNRYITERRSLNLLYYRRTQFSSVHIGDFKIDAIEVRKPKIAVVMPVFN
jgi:hypothetical protein